MSITPQNILRAAVGLIITATILFLVWYFSSVVIYILVSAVLAIMGHPVVNWLARQHIGKYKMPRWAAASLTYSQLRATPLCCMQAPLNLLSVIRTSWLSLWLSALKRAR